MTQKNSLSPKKMYMLKKINMNVSNLKFIVIAIQDCLILMY